MTTRIELSISCEDCVRRDTPDCTECLVSHVLGSEPERLDMTASDVSVAELFASQGLLPRLRYVRDGAEENR